MEALEVDFSDLEIIINKLFKEAKGQQEIEGWKLTIWSELNGYVLEGDVDGIKRRWTIEEDEKDDLKHHERLLWEIIEYFNFGGRKDDPERLRVIREKRDDG